MEIYGMTGERLGTIGNEEGRHDEATLPQWQHDFLSKPSVSIRKGIAWGYASPYEDTDTLVLTAPSSRFIDIRLPKKHAPGNALTGNSAFWAFTGISTTTFPGTSDVPMQHVAHSVWKHDIDSKGPGISDEGDLFVLENRDCVETGMMENPATGKTEMYKEYWTIPSAGANEPLNLKPCVVAKLLDNESTPGFCGLIIRVGDFCQGITGYRSGPKMSVSEVTRFTRASHGWDIDRRSGPTEHVQSEGKGGSTIMPCLWVCDDTRTEGDETYTMNFKWRVTEVVR